MISPLGAWLRSYRTEKRITLREMAKTIDVSAAYLSAVEIGHKPPTQKLIDTISGRFPLHKDEMNGLKRAASKSVTKVTVNLDKNSDAELASVFARNFNHLTEIQKEKIRKILED